LKARKYFLIAFSIVLVDQIVKMLVKFRMEMGSIGEIPIIGDVFKLHFIENKGAAFGMTVSDVLYKIGIDMSPETGKLVLSIFSVVAVFAIGVVLYRIASHKSPLPLFVAIIFGGAVGNIIDRVFYGVIFPFCENVEAGFMGVCNNYPGGLFHGRVVDMFYINMGDVPASVPIFGGMHLWPIFNVADSAISLGILVILLFQRRFFAMDELADNPSPTTETPAVTPPEAPEEKATVNSSEESSTSLGV